MAMRILIVAATGFEILPLKTHLDRHFVPVDPETYQSGDLQVTLLVTGVGIAATVYALTRTLSAGKYDLVINGGIAGAFDRQIALGQVLQVEADTFADLGVEEADGAFRSVFDLQLSDPDQPPFQAGWLHHPDSEGMSFLPKTRGITVHKVHGFAPSIEQVCRKFPAGIETMEGAAFFYVCLMEKIAFLALRSISNYVEPRNREAWDIPLAIDRLNETLIDMLETFKAPFKDGGMA